MFKNLVGELNIAICDDIESDAKRTEAYLKGIFLLPQFENIAYSIQHYGSGEAFLKSKATYDLLFLDVEMPLGMNGFETAKESNKRIKKPLIIFLTIHDSRAAEAFPAGGFRYLSKDFKKEEVVEALTAAIKKIHGNQQIIVQYKDEYGEELESELLYLNDITHLIADDKETVIYTRVEEFRSNRSLKYWEEQLPKDRFYRIHKSYIVNFVNVVDINVKERFVYLDCEVAFNDKLEIARNKVKNVFEALHIFFRTIGSD